MKHLPQSSHLILKNHPIRLLPAGLLIAALSGALTSLLGHLHAPFAVLIGLIIFLLSLSAHIYTWRSFSVVISSRTVQIRWNCFGLTHRTVYPLESIAMIVCEQNIVGCMVDSGSMVLLTRAGYKRYPLLTPFSSLQAMLDA